MCLGINTIIRAWRELGLEKNEHIKENQDLYDSGKKIVSREPSAAEEMRMPCVPDSRSENIDGDTSDEGLVDTDWETITSDSDTGDWETITSDSDTGDGANTCKITGQNTIYSTSAVEVLMSDLPNRIHSWEAKLIANLRQSRFIALPDEVLLQIMHESELSDLYMLRQVSWTFWRLYQDQECSVCKQIGEGLSIQKMKPPSIHGEIRTFNTDHGAKSLIRTFKQLMEPLDPDSELFILEGRPSPPSGVRSAFSWTFSRSESRNSRIAASDPRLERGSIYLKRSGGEFTPKVNYIHDWKDEPYGLNGILASERTSYGADSESEAKYILCRWNRSVTPWTTYVEEGLSWQGDTTKRKEYYSPEYTLFEDVIQRVQQLETEDTQTDWKEYIKTLAPVITILFNLVTSDWLRRKVKNHINKIRKSPKYKEPSSKEKLDSMQIQVNSLTRQIMKLQQGKLDKKFCRKVQYFTKAREF
ncbi:hypothetical protein CSIM01_01823 [Colletotrichum simmondsii]|uniref:F-box domain-containing protein n=1 Tax=Colletotrichum simmondsii TaxID=703756 RepID=A0A135T4I8_9PEZI|nr:hypothetical protein CSIM01_01823 [Colletotrichum simmondsii]